MGTHASYCGAMEYPSSHKRTSQRPATHSTLRAWAIAAQSWLKDPTRELRELRNNNKPVFPGKGFGEKKSDAHDVICGTTAAAAQIHQQIDALERVDIECAAHGARRQRLGAPPFPRPSLFLLVLLVVDNVTEITTSASAS